MRKKNIFYLYFIITLMIFGIETIEVAEDYPYKDNPLKATVFGTPITSFKKIEKLKMPKVKKISTTKDIPELYRPWADFEYGMWLQKEEAPIIILIAGTGALYNSTMNLYFGNVFFEQGYSVFAFSSTTTLPFIVSQSNHSYGGYLPEEVEIFYDIIVDAIEKEKSKGLKYQDAYVGGYSLGGFQSLLLHEIESKEKKNWY